MNRLIAIAIMGAAAGCAAAPSATNDLRAGMTKHQVIALMGTPDSGTGDPEKECSYYNLYRDLWVRPAGDTRDRYSVCFENDSVTSFGLERTPRPVAAGGT